MKEKFKADCIAIVFVILCVTLTSALKHKHRQCIQNGPCLCAFPSGIGVNITKLSEHGLGWTKLNNTADIFFHPCIDKSIGTNDTSNECFNGTSICIRVNQTDNKSTYFNLGNSVDGKFSSQIPNEPISLRFKKNDRNAVVQLLCHEDENYKQNLTASEENGVYVLKLNSYELCSMLSEPTEQNSLSTGSVLVIMFMVFTLVYFIGGILTLKFLRGAEGKEMIPNYEFWADLPYLVRDGIIYALNGCQQSPSYDRI